MRSAFLLVFSFSFLLACGDDDASDGGVADASSDAASDTAPPDGGGADAEPVDDGGSDDAETPDAMADAGDDGGVVPSGGLLYVTVGGENRLATIRVEADGSMMEREGLSLDLGGRPGPLAYAPAASQLFAGVRRGGNSAVATIALSGDGTPSVVGNSSLDNFPVYIDSYGDGQRVVTTYFGADSLEIHDASGDPPYPQSAQQDTPEEPHAAFVQEGRVYVPHRTGGVVSWTELNADGTFGATDSVAAEDGVGPRHIAFHPSGDFAYVVNEFADSVASYRVEDGALVPFGSAATTLPAGFDGDSNTCADIHVHPSGETLYASNRGHDSIAILDIAEDGSVSFRETIETEARPREFELTEAGHLLIAFGQDSGAARSYTVGADGGLTRADRLMIGDNLLWGIFIAD